MSAVEDYIRAGGKWPPEDEAAARLAALKERVVEAATEWTTADGSIGAIIDAVAALLALQQTDPKSDK